MAFTRWDPLRDLFALHEQIGHLVGSDAPGWTPPVDLYETPAAFILSVELPGLSREHIDLHAEDTKIVIRGERSAAPGRQIPSDRYHRVERGHGRFSRSFVLPEAIDVNRVSADLKDGILTVTLPKANAGGTRRIAVS